MQCPISITLTPEEMAVCDVYANAFIRFRKTEDRRAVKALDGVYKPPNSDFDVLDFKSQFDGKASEVAVCKSLGLPINTTLTWDVEACPDTGYDLISRGTKIDVKSMRPHSHYLIWPLNKNHLYEGKDFDIMVSTRGEGKSWEILGWITKQRFYDEKKVAEKGHKLDVGTWHIDIFDGLLDTRWRS